MRAVCLSAAFLGLLAPPAVSQASPGTTLSPNATELAVVRDVALGLRDPQNRHAVCLDPRIANDDPRAASSGQWPTSFLAPLLADSGFAVDTSIELTFRRRRSCALSSRTFRYGLGLPRIVADSATMLLITSWVSQPGEVDSVRQTLRLRREGGEWRMTGTLSDSLIVPRTINGIGCYRFSHQLFRESSEAGLRIDTVLVRAESSRVNRQFHGGADRALQPDQSHVGFPKTEMNPYNVPAWSVTHDTLHLTWLVMDHALFADLHVMGDSLVGRMHTETDVVGVPEPTVSVIGRRVTCP